MRAAVPISTDADMIWHVIRVMSGRELDVAADVSGLSLATYTPITLTWAQIRRRHFRQGGPVFRPVERPWLGGYVLLGACRGDPVDWQAVREVKHVIRPLAASDGTPVVLPGIVIRSMLHREVAGEFRAPAPDAPMPSRRRATLVSIGDRVAVGRTEYVDTVLSIDGICAVLEGSGMKVRLDSLRKAA